MSKKRSLFITALILAVPSILQNLVTNLSQMVDNLMVGPLQEHAIAGVTITNQIFFIFTIVLFGIGGTAGIFMPQFRSIGNEQKVAETFRVSLGFSIATGILFFSLLYFIPDVIFRLFANDPPTLENAHLYLRYILPTFLIFPISLAIGNAFRFTGYIRLPLYVSIITVTSNIFLNYSLIYGHFGFPAMGVQGAALGTMLARIIELAVFVSLTMLIKSPIKLNFAKLFDFEKTLLIHFVKKGYGLVLNELFWSMGMQTIVIIYTQRISSNIAALSIAQALGNMIFIGMGGMSVAFSIILGEHLGLERFKEAKHDAKKLLKMAAVMGLSLGISVFLLSLVLIQFYDVAPEITATAQRLILINASFSWLYYLNASFYFILRSGGDTRSVLFIDSGFTWVVVIPISFLLGSLGLALVFHFFLVQILEFLKLGVAVKMYNKGTWLNNLTQI